MSKLISMYQNLDFMVRSIIVRSIVSTCILSIWSHIATHLYALRYGARLPLEGVPFLFVFAIIAGTALALVSGITLFLIPRKKEQADIPKGNEPGHDPVAPRVAPADFFTRRLSREEIRVVFGIFLTVLGVASLVVTFILVQPRYLTWANMLEAFIFDGIPVEVALVTVLALPMTLASVTSLLGRASVRLIRSSSLIVYVVAGLGVMYMMAGTAFDHLLRVTQYGGGVPVEVETTLGETISHNHLFLVSQDTVTLWDPNNGVFQQINGTEIVRIRYGFEDEWEMPQPKPLFDVLGVETEPQ